MSDTFRISDYITNPTIRAAFERGERDLPPAPALAPEPRPTLTGGTTFDKEVVYA